MKYSTCNRKRGMIDFVTPARIDAASCLYSPNPPASNAREAVYFGQSISSCLGKILWHGRLAGEPTGKTPVPQIGLREKPALCRQAIIPHRTTSDVQSQRRGAVLVCPSRCRLRPAYPIRPLLAALAVVLLTAAACRGLVGPQQDNNAAAPPGDSASKSVLADRNEPPPASRPVDLVRADPRNAQRITPVVKVFHEASPAVVNISTTTIVTVRDSFGFGGLFDEIFDFPTAPRQRQYKANSVGSGFLIHRSGYLVTNAHVVDRVSECKITFADGTELPADQVAIDRKNDLAVLKVDARRPLPCLQLGRSEDLMPGETVIAIGNPLGYQHTVTTGIVSALDRELRFGRDVVYSGLIQVDAPINPGNSGGPLLNVLGELIGINTAIRGDAQNIGFAIPVDRLRELLPVMLDVERLRRVDFGVHFDGDPAAAGPAGVRIKGVDAGSPADKAGLRPGDVVAAIDGQATPTFMEAFDVLGQAPAGKNLKLDVVGQTGKRKTLTVPLLEVARPDAVELMKTRFGIGVRELTPADCGRLGLRQPIGLLVTDVERGSQAEHDGLTPGDLVTKFGGWPVITLESLGHLLEQVSTGNRIDVGVLRIGSDAVIQVELTLIAR